MTDNEREPIHSVTVTDKACDDIIEALDFYARDYNHWDYGLPRGPEHMTAMRELIREALAPTYPKPEAKPDV